MAETTTPQIVRSYLAQLESALAGLASEVRSEIVAGIREELEGLDAADAAVRIESLGDPEFIAAEARAEAAETPGGPPLVEPVATPGREPGWYPVLAALLVAFGGIVVPVVGWVVGLALVWLSKTWTRAEKLVATAVAPAAMLAVVALTLTARLWAPGDALSPNPLLPAFYDVAWSSVLLLGGVNVVVGIWLLWRAKRAQGEIRGPEASAARQQAPWFPVVAVLLIMGGGYLVPFVGWVAGVTMLWLADRWSIRDKWLGTLAGPLAAVAVLGVGALAGLAPGGLGGWHATILGVMVAPLIVNVMVGVHLLRRAR